MRACCISLVSSNCSTYFSRRPASMGRRRRHSNRSSELLCRITWRVLLKGRDSDLAAWSHTRATFSGKKVHFRSFSGPVSQSHNVRFRSEIWTRMSTLTRHSLSERFSFSNFQIRRRHRTISKLSHSSQLTAHYVIGVFVSLLTMTSPTPDSLSIPNIPTDMKMVPSTAHKRRLTFSTAASQVITVLSRDDYTQQEKAACWWSTSDHSGFRENARTTMRETQKLQQDLIIKMQGAYKVAKFLGRNRGCKDFSDLLQDPSHHCSQLDEWVARADGCRGLERHIWQARRSDCLEIRALVVDTDRMSVSDDEITEVYTEHSNTHTLYARMVGVSDYRAVYSI
jgi:hypothetical protein